MPGPFQRHVSRGRQADVMLGRFDDVIVEPGFHRLHRNLLAAGAREHDDRAFPPLDFDGEQNGDSVGPAQLIVCHNQIPPSGFDGLGEFLGIGGLLKLAVGKLPADLPHDQCAVVRVVIHQQNLQLVVHNFFYAVP